MTCEERREFGFQCFLLAPVKSRHLWGQKREEITRIICKVKKSLGRWGLVESGVLICAV